jgi:hypothetical protein
MKSLQKITRVQLKVSQDEESVLVGIVSAEPDYKISQLLNKKFRISLKNISPVKLADESGSELVFSRFSDQSASPDRVFTLISNRTGKYFLLKKLKNVDYIFQVQDSEAGYNSAEIVTNLREIDSLTAVFIIDINTLKDKNSRYLIQ